VVNTKEVYVVSRAIRYGERLTEKDVRLVAWPENAIPEGAFVKGGAVALFPEGESRPRSILRAMEKDEALLAIKVTKPGEDAGVASRLSKGMRAFAIQVDVQAGVSGFLRPGDRVDIYWTGQNGQRDSGIRNDVTKLILTGMGLIAIDQSADEDSTKPSIARTVTVEATPQQVAALAQAQATGRLILSLVGAADNTVAEASDVDQRSLLGLQERQVVQVEEERVCTIKTRRGAEIIETPITCTN
jgi:pilus assembly protein CpaB